MQATLNDLDKYIKDRREANSDKERSKEELDKKICDDFNRNISEGTSSPRERDLDKMIKEKDINFRDYIKNRP